MLAAFAGSEMVVSGGQQRETLRNTEILRDDDRLNILAVFTFISCISQKVDVSASALCVTLH